MSPAKSYALRVPRHRLASPSASTKDDFAFADPDHLPLQEQSQEWKDRLEESGMHLNTKKMEYLKCGPQTLGSIQIDGQELKKTTQFPGLGGQRDPPGCALMSQRSMA
ncbi:far upstream element-binding protein [Sarotherodon galilaeus]